MQELPIQLPCELTALSTMSQGKLKITFVSQELVPHELKARLLENHEATGWMSFLAGEKNITADMVADLPEIEKREEDKKSPSRALKDVLYVLYEQRGKPTATFEEFYRVQMEKFISAVKEKLT